MVFLMMSRWPHGRRNATDRSRVAALGQVLDGMKFGNHCKVDDFQHQADTERVADGANGPSHVTKAGTQPNATERP